MIKKIGKVTYDTNSSVIVKKNTFGNYGDTDGYEETLYVTEKGNYFLYCYGGSDSPYPEEKIKTLSKENAKKYL